MYDVICYKNTGFNAVNIPDSPALLAASGTAISLPATDIVQDRGIAKIRVRANWETIQDVDYCVIGSTFYSVDCPHMIAVDTAELTLTLDAINTLGGVSGLTILDGITERHHLATNTLFGNVEPDPFLGATQPLLVETAGPFFTTSDNADLTISESTLKLSEMATNTTADEYETAAGGTVSVPTVVTITDDTTVSMTTPDGTETANTPATEYFEGTNSSVQAGIAKARSLGLEGGIIGQYILPGVAYSSYNASLDGVIGSLVGNYETASPALSYEYGTAINKRVYAGDANRFCIISPASGNSAEFNPEDTYDGSSAAPSVFMAVDPRRTGKPYFRFAYYKGTPWYVNCVSGLSWQTAPMSFTTASGSEISFFKWNTEKEIRENEIGYSLKQMISGSGSGTGASASGIQGTGKQLLNRGAAWVTGKLSPILSIGSGISQEEFEDWSNFYASGDLSYYKSQQQAKAALEAAEFGFSQTLIVPQIMFPRSETLRDFVGNGVFVYRYRYSDVDLALNDKKLTMYGEKHTAPLEASFFANRKYFNYIKTNGCSLGGTAAKWLRDYAATQFAVGVRIWHVKPDPAYYTQENTIV